MASLRVFMAKTFLKKKDPQEIMAFADEVRAALTRGQDGTVLAKRFLRFENPELAAPTKL